MSQFSPGTRVWVEVKALDANGNRVGYVADSIRTGDTRSLAFSPKGNRFSDRFSVHITDVPSATTGFDFKVLNPSNGQVIAARNFSTNPSSYNNGGINVVSVCAQGCNVSAKLKPGTNYNVEIIAKEVMYEITRQRKSARTKALTLGNSAPASEPTLAPIALAADLHNHSEVTLQWSAVSGATGYVLDYAGSDMISGSYPLGAGATSQRITGLSPGATYRVTLTASLPGGGKHSGEISFVMPMPPPTNTLVPPPTNTLVPPPTNTPVPPPTNTPLPPPTNTPLPPPTNTPVPPPTNTPVPPPTNTLVPPPPNTPVPPPLPSNTPIPPPPTNTPVPQQSYSVPDRLMQTVRDYYDTNVAAGRTGNNWLRVLIAFGAETHDTLSPMTAAEARERVSRWGGWKPIAEALEQLEG